MKVDKRPAPERFRYCDLKEALRQVHLMGIQSDCKLAREVRLGEASIFGKKMASPGSYARRL
jgi:hypothetical protein